MDEAKQWIWSGAKPGEALIGALMIRFEPSSEEISLAIERELLGQKNGAARGMYFWLTVSVPKENTRLSQIFALPQDVKQWESIGDQAHRMEGLLGALWHQLDTGLRSDVSIDRALHSLNALPSELYMPREKVWSIMCAWSRSNPFVKADHIKDILRVHVKEASERLMLTVNLGGPVYEGYTDKAHQTALDKAFDESVKLHLAS